MNISYYDYEKLANAALKSGKEEDLNSLGEWFERYGNSYWNGEKYEIDSTHFLRPIYREINEDDFETTGYELCY